MTRGECSEAESSLHFAYLFQQCLVKADAGFEIRYGEIFVWGMCTAIGEGEAEEESIHAEDILEALHDGNRSAFADHGDGALEGSGEGALGCLAETGIGIGNVGVAAVTLDDLDLHAARDVFAEMLDDLRDSLGGGLAWHEAEGELGKGGMRDDGLGPLPLVAAADAVDLHGGTGPHALQRAVTGLADQRGGAGDLQQPRLVEREAGPCVAFPVEHWLDRVAEAGNGDPSGGVVQGREEAREGGDGVLDGAPVNAGVQVDGGAGDADFNAADAAQAVGESGHAGADHGAVRDDDHVALQFRGVFRQECGEVGAADLFLALDDEQDVDRQIAPRRE